MKIDTIKRISRIPIRFAVIALLHFFVCQLLWFSAASDSDIEQMAEGLLNGKFLGTVCVIIMVLFYYSLVRVTSVHDAAFRKRYADRQSMPPLKGRLSVVLGWKRFYVELAVYILLLALLPPDFYLGLCNLLGADSPNLRLYYLLTIIPGAILLNFLARLSATRSLDHGGYANTEYDSEKAAGRAYTKAMLFVVLIYLFGGLMLCYLLPLLLTFLPVLQELATLRNLILLCVILLIPFAVQLIRLLRKRKKFLKELRTVCRERGYNLSKIERPYRSLFSVAGGESFLVEAARGKRYSCRFISARKKNDPLIILENGVCGFTHTVRLFKVDLFSRVSEYSFAYESEHPKILILNPVPKKAFCVKNGRTVELDNGDSAGGYKIFTATGFLNALERDCIDRKV